MKEKNKYITLFLSTFQLSACTFGGGFVIIPLMRKKFVEKLGWIEEQEMLDLTAIAQSSPGAIAVNASIIIGYRIAGFLGALVSVAGTVLPPLIIISIISFFYAAFRDNVYISMAMTGMLAAVGAVICDVVITMMKNVFTFKRPKPIIIFAACFIAGYFFNVNIILIILVCGAIGAFDSYKREKARKERDF